MNNLVSSVNHQAELDNYRQNLMDWCIKTNDTKFLKKIILPSKSKKLSNQLFDKPY